MVTKGSFSELSDEEKLPVLLGEESKSSKLAAVYVSARHTLRDSETHTQTISWHTDLFFVILYPFSDFKW